MIPIEDNVRLLLTWSVAMLYLMYRTNISNRNKPLFLIMFTFMFGIILYIVGYMAYAMAPFMVAMSIIIWKNISDRNINDY